VKRKSDGAMVWRIAGLVSWKATSLCIDRIRFQHCSEIVLKSMFTI
jgi:hypothetical protein